jgi:hypothetical protein
MLENLRRTAKMRSAIAYSDLSRQLQSIQAGYHDPPMDNMPMKISSEEARNGRGILFAMERETGLEPATSSLGK